MMALDAFCGAGGASLGLHRAGLDVHGYDHWQPAVDTHNANGLPATLLDLSTDDPPHPGEPFAMWASPPCQPFSAAGDGAGEFDGRDGFPWLLRIVGRLLPDVLFVENVKGLTFEGHAAYFGGVLASLRALGYDVQWKVLNTADYGVPQTRERCIIVARRDGGPISWPAPTHTETEGLFTRRWVTMAEALGWGDGCAIAYTVPAATEVGGPRMDGAGSSAVRRSMVAERDEGRWLLSPGLTMSQPNRRHYDPTSEPAPTVAVGHDTCGWTWTRPATSINGDPRVSAPGRHDPNVSGSQQADAIRLTIAELACLQGFPPDWTWTGTKTAQARQVGNAVPPALAEAVVRANLTTRKETR